MTTTMNMPPSQKAQLKQLVLFPELLGMLSVPPDWYQGHKNRQIQIEEQSIPVLLLEKALAAGQMVLW